MEKFKEYIKRYLLLIVALFIMAFGIALSTKARLGTTPISSVPLVLSLGLPWSMGKIVIVMQVVFVVLQIVILRREYQPLQLLQLVVAFIFGYFTDFTLNLVSDMQIHSYIVQWLVCIVSIFVVALGVFLEIKANVVMLAGEGLVKAIAQKTRKDFGKIKMCFDSALVIISVSASVYMFNELKGVREGTIAAALLVGNVVSYYNKRLNFIGLWFQGAEQKLSN
ncbi:DUF6198 family protein [Clostridium tagluense]|uniref:YczE/YyaS/YitT family protein n=1 Tax=Clostridium tagluense TaxID=360422 RepID=UPI001CF2FE7F|nr:DUF6198 family protein [Clostridium tagluense]MCB2311594.1 DUF6198 family protein [Clostridium tagluense]MCB2316318.1 DUF6198 family protein [Clostridium tagluense]MCB2321298.1 DUF6198 family protein [Clostridium tagluense]MCB2326187.1 DUF6198 family protein [Clostridium tagluense]MCB2331034.1 DUF6198 family protein [Clostridium tagluense]